MGRPPCCDKSNVKRGLWTAEEDAKILAYISTHGTGNWTSVPKKAGLKRCGKSCRLRWTNYLRPDLKHESFTSQEAELIVSLHALIGSRWSLIAAQLPGRTDNDVKNYWNTKLRKKLFEKGIDPVTHKPFSQILADYGTSIGLFNGISDKNSAARYQISTKNRLNRDLRKAFMHKSEPLKSPKKEISISQTQDVLLNDNPKWDLLAQLQAIKLVSEASSNCTKPYLLFNDSTSITTHQDIHQAPAPPIYPSQKPSSSSSFSWSDFLLEDAFLQPGQQELQPTSSAPSSSTNQIPQEFFNRNLNGVGDSEKGSSMLGILGDDDDYGVSSSNSFVEAILDQQSQMLWDFSDLLDDQFDFS